MQEAFRTERAQRAGMANAASGRIMVTCAGDHFGPILAEHDPERGLVRNVAIPLCVDWHDSLPQYELSVSQAEDARKQIDSRVQARCQNGHSRRERKPNAP